MKELTVDQFRNLTEDNQAVQLFQLLRKSQRSLLGREEEEENGAGREEEGDNVARVEEEGENEDGGTKSVVPLWERINNRLAQPKKLNKETTDSSGKFYIQEEPFKSLFRRTPFMSKILINF